MPATARALVLTAERFRWEVVCGVRILSVGDFVAEAYSSQVRV